MGTPMKTALPKILVVDDEPRTLEPLTRSLRGQAQISTATSGEEALELFSAGRFLLVISDQRMPGIAGVDLLGRMAEIDDSTGRILLTGYADLDATVGAINRGRVHAYLHKPCSPPELISTVKAVTDRVKLARENLRLRTAIAALIEVLSARAAEESSEALALAVDELIQTLEFCKADGTSVGVQSSCSRV